MLCELCLTNFRTKYQVSRTKYSKIGTEYYWVKFLFSGKHAQIWNDIKLSSKAEFPATTFNMGGYRLANLETNSI